MIHELTISTAAEGFHDITADVRRLIAESNLAEGTCVVFCPHTTAGLTINENADPDVITDMLLGLSLAFPDRPQFAHAEGNSAAHLKASCVGSSVSVLIHQSRPVLGTWQGIYLCEFDGPRRRKVLVRVSQ